MAEETSSEIMRTAVEYEALKAMFQKLEQHDQEPPDTLLELESQLVRRLIVARAECGDELAHKANVLLDWVAGEDTVSELTLSLCRDTVRVFPVARSGDEAGS